MRKVLLTALIGIAAVLLGSTPANADVNDFGYAKWSAKYELGLDADGRAVAHVTETLVPVFPDFDQNRGIVRALPMRYEDAPAAPEDISVTDAEGRPVPFTTEEVSNDAGVEFRAILVGDDSFVHGRQHYVIRYTLHDVVLAATGTGRDEFYWDVLPIERAQPVAAFSASVTFGPELATHLTGDAACYLGPADATRRCDITGAAASANGPVTVKVPKTAVGPGSGVTIAIGMDPGTVTQPPQRVPNFALDGLPLILASGAGATGLAAPIAVSALKRRRRTFRGTVVAQYDVPDRLPPLIAAPIVGGAKNIVPSEFVHLAVRGATRIEESDEDGGFFSGKPLPAFRLLDPDAAPDPMDRRTLTELFTALTPGARFQLPKKSSSFASRMQHLVTAGDGEALARGYFTREASRTGRILGLVALGIVGTTVPLLLLGLERPGSFTFVVGALLVGAIVLALSGIPKHRVHSPLGAETREYLLGVRLFIEVAEADRIRTLQSYTGSERLEDSDVDVVRVYERLLPYAMLFGMEKEWGRVLETRYEAAGVTAPIWYPSLATAGISGLHRSLGDFTSQLNSSASYSSSSSGGSGGGGFSGGGGGGGFSGGR